MKIEKVYVCIGTIVPLNEKEQINIVKSAIASSRKHSNVFDQVFEYVFKNKVMIDRSTAEMPFTDDEDLPVKTRDLFMQNNPSFDYKKKVNYVMHFGFMKGGKEYIAAVFFLFD